MNPNHSPSSNNSGWGCLLQIALFLSGMLLLSTAAITSLTGWEPFGIEQPGAFAFPGAVFVVTSILWFNNDTTE